MPEVKNPKEVFIGDDAAVLEPFAGQVIISTDVCVFGVHLDRNLFSLEDLGFKAVTSALSDLAAMGAWPRGVVLGVSAPPGTDLDLLHHGASMAAMLCDVPVVGGDVTSSRDVSVAVTVFGECPGNGAVLRSTAQPGDGIYVSAPLGRSSAGLRLARAGAAMADDLVVAHRRPFPRLREGLAYRNGGATAMMDLSDGLGLDLHRMADASGVGFELDSLPIATGATLLEAVAGGEDYELVLTASDEGRLFSMCDARGVPRPLRIGTMVADPAVRTLRGASFPRQGFEHQL
jgi:thiamine-monophosphate kinase